MWLAGQHDFVFRNKVLPHASYTWFVFCPPPAFQEEGEHRKVLEEQVGIPDGEAGDDFVAARPGEQGQKAVAVPLGNVARGWSSLPLVRDLHRVQPQSLGLVLHCPKPVRGGGIITRSPPKHNDTGARPRSPTQPSLLPASLVAVGLIRDARKVLIPVQPCHQLVPLPHAALEVPPHRHDLRSHKRAVLNTS